MTTPTPLADGQEPLPVRLFPINIDVTLEQHLDLLKSPKKCLALGIDITFERMMYEHRRAFNDMPPLPDIDPNEEIDVL